MLKSEAERRLAALSLDDLPIAEVPVRLQNVAPDWFARYKALRLEFIKSLTDSMEELSFMNLSQDEFMHLIMGRAIPENTTIRFRVPLVYGGELKISNLFLCRTFPISYNLDRFIMEQAGSASIWMPNPAKKVYVPTHLLGGGPGGNATDDRLAQMSAQFAAMGNSME